MFLKAAKMKLRFPSPKGLLSVEDLFDLPLNSTRAGVVTLNGVAITIHKSLQEQSDISFVDEVSANDTTMQLRMDIIKEVIKLKKAENASKLEARDKIAKKKRLMELINNKQDEELAGKSLAELTAMVDAL
jgi:hypothetical protein